jgi:hypothetical protein
VAKRASLKTAKYREALRKRRNVEHQDNVLRLKEQSRQYAWITDGVEVSCALSPNVKQVGLVLGLSFPCPFNMKAEYENEKCVHLFFPDDERIRLSSTTAITKRRPSTIAKRRRHLAKVMRMHDFHLGISLATALFETYRNRPVFAVVNESSFFSSSNVVYKSGINSQVSLYGVIGWEVHSIACGVVESLQKTYLIPRDGSQKHLVVVYGTQKSENEMSLHIGLIMGNYNLFHMVNYLDIKPTLENLVKNLQLKHLVFFVPELLVEEACLVLQTLPATVHNIVLATFSHQSGIRENACGACGTDDRIRTTTLSEMVDRAKAFPCAQKPLTPVYPHSGKLIVARMNEHGVAETVVYPYNLVSDTSVRSTYKMIKNWPASPKGIMISEKMYPLSSGDVTDVMDSVLEGGLFVLNTFGHARDHMVSYTIQPNFWGGSPVQLRHILEEYNLKSSVLNRKTLFVFDPSNLISCYTGGGAPNPLIENFLTRSMHCKNVMEGWGSYENWAIARGKRNVYEFTKENVVDWTIESFGPYDKNDGMGELLLATKHMTTHTDRAFNRKRYMKKNGLTYLHTRDIVVVVEGEPGVNDGTKVSMIDKTTCPFKVMSMRWVRTGVIERAIEGDQAIVENAVVMGSPSAETVGVVVWLSNKAASWSETKVLQYCTIHLQGTAKPWEIPSTVLIADEPWEYRPRSKVRKLLQMKFGLSLNERLPHAVDANIARRYNLNVENNKKYTKLIFQKLNSALGGTCGSWEGISTTRADASLCDLILGCVVGQSKNGGCMLRSFKNDKLREPSLRHRPYDPTAPREERLQRLDNEPWHFWDLKSTLSSETMVSSLISLEKHQNALNAVLPLILPSLGLLIPFGVRFRMRLDCAIRLAKEAPHVFAGSSSKDVYYDVYKVCRPDFYLPISSSKTYEAVLKQKEVQNTHESSNS